MTFDVVGKIGACFQGVIRGERFRSIVAATTAVALVALAFQALWVVTMSVFTLQFFLMPLYFVITCAMIIFGIQSLEGHGSSPSS